MAKTYAIQTLDAQGAVILSVRGRAGALAKAVDWLEEYRAACKAASGHLFTFDKARRDTVMVDGAAIGACLAIGDLPEEMIRGFDRLGVDSYVMHCRRAADQVAAA